MATNAEAGEPMTPTRHRPPRAEILRDLRKGASHVAKALAVIVTAAAALFASLLVLHIIFVLFSATPTNSIVKHVNQWAHDLAGPFRTLFAFKDKKHQPKVKLTDTVNYGIAAVAYLLGGRFIGTMLRKLAP
jgi:cobalamin synthase